MSTYLAAEQAALTTARAYNSGATFTTANSSRNDFGVVQSAKPLALVVSMGGPTTEGDDLNDPDFANGRGSHGMYQERHIIKLTVYCAVGTGQTGYTAQVTALQTAVEGLKDHIRARNTLGGAVSFARSKTTSEVKELAVGGGGVTHLVQEITLNVYCESEIPDGEDGW